MRDADYSIIATAVTDFMQASDFVGLIFDSCSGQAVADPAVSADDKHFYRASRF